MSARRIPHKTILYSRTELAQLTKTVEKADLPAEEKKVLRLRLAAIKWITGVANDMVKERPKGVKKSPTIASILSTFTKNKRR
jgi:hypothetical protein